MKRIAQGLFAALLAGVVIEAASADGHLRIQIDPNKLRPIPNQQITPRTIVPLQPCSVDLAAILQTEKRSDGRVNVTYGVRNVGSAGYSSGRNQQVLSLTRNGSKVADLPFSSLAAGQAMQREAITPGPFEFPDKYVALLSFDPDIAIDGNAANDDCRSANNRAEATVER